MSVTHLAPQGLTCQSEAYLGVHLGTAATAARVTWVARTSDALIDAIRSGHDGVAVVERAARSLSESIDTTVELVHAVMHLATNALGDSMDAIVRLCSLTASLEDAVIASLERTALPVAA